MKQPITDYVLFLQQAREAVVELTGMKERREQLSQEEHQLEKVLEAENKTISNMIQQTIKKRSEELIDSYDQELTRGQERLKKVRVKREKAKNKGMRERINDDTEELHKENKELQLQIKTLFYQNRIPVFCNTNWYYTIFFPGHFGEVIQLFLILAMCFLVIPYGSYLLIPKKETIFLVAIYIVAIVFFGGFYILINNQIKMPHIKAFEEGRLFRDQIRSNKKKIRIITRSIRKDRNESFYNLQKFDDEIAQTEQELTEIGIRKRDALNTFEKVTKTILADEINHSHRPHLDQLEEKLGKVRGELQSADVKIKEDALFITDNFEIYLGKEFLQISNLDELLHIMEEESASNINEAIEYYKKTREY